MKNTHYKKIVFSLSLLLRNAAYAFIRIFVVEHSSKKPNVVVYCYHSISNYDWRFSVSKEQFEKQMNWLFEWGTPITPVDFEKYMRGELHLTQNSFLITFDDGYQDVLQVKEFLHEKGIQPIVFVLSNRDQVNRSELETDRSLLSDAEISELKVSGWSIGSHGATHPDFAKISHDQIQSEIVGSKEVIEKKLNCSVDYFAYPKGVYSSEILNTVKSAGYKLGFSMDDEVLNTTTDPFAVSRVGVDGTHSMKQFISLALPCSIWMRKILKKFI